MANILCILGSPSAPSRTAFMADYVVEQLGRAGHAVETLVLRDLPAEDLVKARMNAPEIAKAIAQVESAQAVIVATPIYKAAYSGLLKTFLDLLPQFGLQDKAILTLATSGGPAHVMAIDYALRPVLMSLGAHHVEPSWVIMEQGISKQQDGKYELTAETRGKLDEMAGRFSGYLKRHAHDHT
ncbi:MAG TPA: NADPH-dependent FMN reductase [Polyangiaceae bacterium]|jgi:FMN reductase